MFLTLMAALSSAAATTPLPSPSVRKMIRDVRRWTATDGERLWRGFRQAPVQVDLIGDRSETLFCRPAARGFVPRGRDTVTGCPMLSRPRVLNGDLAASLGIGDNVQVIAIGLPATLDMSASAWRATLLHESFHQYQSALPGYRDAVRDVRRALQADADDWPLTYAFPYADPEVGKGFAAMTAAARRFLAGGSAKIRQQAVTDYILSRRQARAAVPGANWRYYEFQVGQEGVARWTEIALADSAGKRDPGMAAEARDRRAALASSLNAIDAQGLRVWKRSALYVYGAIEAEMLEQANPKWRITYQRIPFGLGEMLDKLADATAATS